VTTNVERVIAFLRQYPGSTDTDIREGTRIQPHQQVNQIANRLGATGIVLRIKGSDGKYHNYLASTGTVSATTSLETRSKTATPYRRSTGAWPAFPQRDQETLVLIECSGKKRRGGEPRIAGSRLHEEIDPDVARELLHRRRSIADEAHLDERLVMPAVMRYSGPFYDKAAAAIEHLVEQDVRVLVLSGGYGVVLALEAIGWYDRKFRIADWSKGLLDRVMRAYVQRHRLTKAVAFLPITSDYAKAARGVQWHAHGVGSALLVSPVVRGGGMRKSPLVCGEALAAWSQGELRPGWLGEYRTPLAVAEM
jgi:hypothetical protein